MTITAQENQTLYNVAFEQFGSRDAAAWIGKANGLLLDAILRAGQILTLPDSLSIPASKSVKDTLTGRLDGKNQQIRIATGQLPLDAIALTCMDDGVIGECFIIGESHIGGA